MTDTETIVRIDARGLPTVEIFATKDGAEGELFSYACTVTADGHGLFACVLRRTDRDEPYRVEKRPGLEWTCTCADRTFRGHRRRGKAHCKHVAAARGLKALFGLHPSHQTQGVAV